MKISLRPIDSIRPYDGNPRDYGEAIAAVAKSLKEFGFRQPIVVDADGVIIVGHVRWLAAKELGLAKVPVHVATDLTAEQIRAYRLADNKTGEIAEWNLDLLTIELEQLGADGFDVGGLGWDQEELARLVDPGLKEGLCNPDDVPAPPDAATTQPGDIWLLGEHRLMCGDSSSPADLDKLLAGQPIHLVNTDPPYNVKVEPRSNNAIAAGGDGNNQGFDKARHAGKAKGTTAKLRAKDRPLANDFVSDAEFDRLLLAWFGNISRVLLPGRGFYCWGGYANIANYPAALKASQLYFSQAIIWVKEHPVLSRKDFMGNHEWCFYGWREGAAHQFHGPANIQDTWQLSRERTGNTAIGAGVRLEAADGSRLDVLPPNPQRDKLRVVVVGDQVDLHGPSLATDVWRVKKVNQSKMVHLTEKPVELARRAMEYSSVAGEHVLDLFGGSGSTLIAAEQLGRKAYLMELDPLYCDVIVARWEQFTGKKAERVGDEKRPAKKPAKKKAG